MWQQLTKYIVKYGYDQTMGGVVSDEYCFRGMVSAIVALSKKLVSIRKKLALNSG